MNDVIEARLQELAQRFIELSEAPNDPGHQISKHRKEHLSRSARWKTMLEADNVDPGQLLEALEETDWIGGGIGPRKTVQKLTADAAGAGDFVARLREIVSSPPAGPEEMKGCVDSLPGIGLSFLSELLCYTLPEKYWEFNAPVREMVSLLGFDAKKPLPRGKKTDFEHYFALRPFMEMARKALSSAGWEDPTYLDVDLMLYEASRNPQMFPIPYPLNLEALEHRIDVLRQQYPGMKSFADPTWIEQERAYKEELAERLHALLVEPTALDPEEAARRTLELLKVRLERAGGVQNLVDWRSVRGFEEALNDAKNASGFGRAVLGVIHGRGSFEARVARCSQEMVRLGSSRAFARMLPTLLAMLMDPDHEILIRTSEFRRAAKALTGSSILRNDMALDEEQYRNARRFARTLFDALKAKDLEPQDMIDVQGFIFITDKEAAVENDSKPTPATRDATSDLPGESSAGLGGILAALEEDELHFPPDLVAEYVLALQTKRFVILTGISGTGKTRLAMKVAGYFTPRRTVTESSRLGDGTVGMTIRPYMKKFNRILLPRSLSDSAEWEITEGNKSCGRIDVEYPGGFDEISFHRNPKTDGITVFLSRGVKEWFGGYSEAGRGMLVHVETNETGIATKLVIREPHSGEVIGSTNHRGYSVVAVRPDWTDHRGLLGYYNPLTGCYLVTPFLRLLLETAEEFRRAQEERREPVPSFVILDEMNLARVEHYFSDLLSAMESGEPIHLHDDRMVEEGETDGEPIPRELVVPPNLYVVGTVNVDETTYMFSPKVLDRAFTLELNEVDLAGYGAGNETEQELPLPGFRELPGRWTRPSREDWRRFSGIADGRYRDLLIELNGILETDRRHFGYRVANEIARFVCLGHEQSGGSEAITRVVFDMAVHAKILPKLHGTQQELQEILERLFGFAIEPMRDAEASWQDHERWRLEAGRLVPDDGGGQPAPEDGEGSGTRPRTPFLPRTAAKLHRMLNRLERQGFTSFIE